MYVSKRATRIPEDVMYIVREFTFQFVSMGISI
jgi:hypothetical protein